MSSLFTRRIKDKLNRLRAEWPWTCTYLLQINWASCLQKEVRGWINHIQWRGVGFWRPGQKVKLAPLCQNFSQKISKVVDPKEFGSNKSSVPFHTSTELYIHNSWTNLNFSLCSLTNMHQMVGLLFFVIDFSAPLPPSGAPGTSPPPLAHSRPRPRPLSYATDHIVGY